MTTIEHRAPDGAITERIVDPAVKPAADLAGHLDQCLARLTGFSRGWPAVDYLQGLAAAMKEGEKQALAEVGRAGRLATPSGGRPGRSCGSGAGKRRRPRSGAVCRDRRVAGAVRGRPCRRRGR